MGIDINNLGLGRREAPDSRDNQFRMSAVLPASPKEVTDKTYRNWYAQGWWGNQGASPMCVGYSWAHWVEDGPITQKGMAPIAKPQDIYHQAQTVDEWPGEDYEGTSVRAGAKALQSMGFIQSYLWAWDVDTVANAVLTTGPVVVGTNWYDDMFSPNSSGLIKLGGTIAGGHAYLLNGVNMTKKLFRIKNSWGRDWGKNGHAYISFSDMGRLIAEDGEACLAVEIKK